MADAPLVLGFDTSAAHCAAALLSGKTVLAQRREAMAKGQAERLMPFLEEVLAQAAVGWSDLDALGVGVGPGNFTGIRIAVAAARGLALGLGIPAVGVSTLEAQAHGLGPVVVSSLDARRGQIYLQVVGGGPPGLSTLTTPPKGIPETAAPAVVGFGAEVIAPQVSGHVARPAMPLAEAIARIAAARRFSTKTRPAPLYLRAADAAPPRDPAPVILP